MERDAYGNPILATVDGWKITAGQFCYDLTKDGKTYTTTGSLESAKNIATSGQVETLLR